MHGLFGKGLVLCSGFTQVMIQKLKTERIVETDRGTKVIGGNVSDVVVQRCLQRMKAHVALAESNAGTII